MNSVFECAVCKVGGQTLRCARCQSVYYCSKEHQRRDWKRHKVNCQSSKSNKFDDNQNTTIIFEGSSENEILKSQTQILSPNLDFRNLRKKSPTTTTTTTAAGATTMPPQNCVSSSIKKPELINNIGSGNVSGGDLQTKNRNTEIFVERICKNVIHDLETFGVCVVNNFLGIERGTMVLNEVMDMYRSGVFKDGQLVSSSGRHGDHKTIRGDQIAWIDGNESNSVHVGQLIREVDAIIMRANRMSTGRLSEYTINGRTKAMVACYPGTGAHYVKHVDNPNKDGRCVTAIYYLNKEWDVKRDGGLLRIFPEGSDKVADIEPFFDRLLFFWSDRTNPHEVQPAFKTRYAITLWYFDAQEREQACKRFQISNKPKSSINDKKIEPRQCR